jgi:hypothetical protein
MNRRTFVAGAASALAVGPALALPAAAEPHIVRAWAGNVGDLYGVFAKMSDGSIQHVEGRSVRALFNGEPVKYVIWADVGEGIYCHDPHPVTGRPYLQDGVRDSVKRLLRGDIKIVFAEMDWPLPLENLCRRK